MAADYNQVPALGVREPSPQEVIDAMKATISEQILATLDPQLCDRATAILTEIQNTRMFPLLVLQVAVHKTNDISLRQAAAIYFKNLVVNNWNKPETNRQYPNGNNCFNFHETDRAAIRDCIFDVTMDIPMLVSSQLGLCMKIMIKSDFPSRWGQIVEYILFFLQAPNFFKWEVAALGMLQFVQVYEYNYSDPVYMAAIKILLPELYNVMMVILEDDTDRALLLQKQILKIFYTLTHLSLPPILLNKDVFSQWMEIFYKEAKKQVPPIPQGYEIPDESRIAMPFWQMRKWAVRILKHLFCRFGSPSTCDIAHAEFSNWYLTMFTGGIIEVLLQILEQHRTQTYISPKVLIHTIEYITQSVRYSHSWKFLKQYMVPIIRDVVFPFMSHNDEIEDLLVNDPTTYLRYRTEIIDCLEFRSPNRAATTLLILACKKRKSMLLPVLQFVSEVVNNNSPLRRYNAYEVDGALHMIGSLNTILIKRPEHSALIEEMLISYILPLTQNSPTHMRARAFWVLHQFSYLPATNVQHLTQVMNTIINTVLDNTSPLPIKFEAILGIKQFLLHHLDTNRYILPKLQDITLEILNMLRITEHELLVTVLRKLLSVFVEELTPIAKTIVSHLITTFFQVSKGCQGFDEKTITSVAVLNTIDIIIAIMIEKDGIIKSLEPIVLSAIPHIIDCGFIDFYEEVLSIIYRLTSKNISLQAWQIFEKIYDIIQKDGLDYFPDIVPVLYNYISKDTHTFMSQDSYSVALFIMCKSVIEAHNEEDLGCSAAKLLEVTLLHCKGHVDNAVSNFIMLALQTLNADIRTSELRAMCLQVIIAAMYYNPDMWLEIMLNVKHLHFPRENTAMKFFIKLWIADVDCFLGIHDRKLGIIGFCTILGMQSQKRALVLDNEDVPKIMSSCLLLFEGLKRAREAKLALDEEIDSDGCSGEVCNMSDENEGMSSDNDEINTHHSNYHNPLFDECSDIEEFSNMNDAPLEMYTTPLDDYDTDENVIFYMVLDKLKANEESFYAALTQDLNDNEKTILKNVIAMATPWK